MPHGQAGTPVVAFRSQLGPLHPHQQKAFTNFIKSNTKISQRPDTLSRDLTFSSLIDLFDSLTYKKNLHIRFIVIVLGMNI